MTAWHPVQYFSTVHVCVVADTGGMSTGQIVGTVFGVILGLLVVSAVAFYGWKFYSARRVPYRVL